MNKPQESVNFAEQDVASWILIKDMMIDHEIWGVLFSGKLISFSQSEPTESGDIASYLFPTPFRDVLPKFGPVPFQGTWQLGVAVRGIDWAIDIVTIMGFFHDFNL